ncbi:MAG: hypothetical protein AB2603_07445 [Candidatus Thiodiazotropha endolucinida]
MEDNSKRILVFFWLGQYINPDAGVIEPEQENVRNQLAYSTAHLIGLTSTHVWWSAAVNESARTVPAHDTFAQGRQAAAAISLVVIFDCYGWTEFITTFTISG